MDKDEVADIVDDFTSYIRFHTSPKYSTSQWLMAIEYMAELFKKQRVELDLYKNHTLHLICEKCGKEFTAKRKDARYCSKCSKLNQKAYYHNQSDEWKHKRAEKSKLKMRELRARRKQEKEAGE